MSTNISRRSIAKGAAWATPAVLATATVPAYAASTAPKNLSYRFGRQGKATYDEAHDSSGRCTYNVATFTTRDVKGLPWASGHGIVYFEGAAVDTTATLNKYTIRVAYPKNTTSGNWRIDNPAWSVRRVSAQYFTDSSGNIGTDSFYVGDRDIYEFTFNGTRSAPVYQLGAGNNEWPDGAFTAVDNTRITYCARKTNDTVYYIEYSWDFTTANGFADRSTDATLAR